MEESNNRIQRIEKTEDVIYEGVKLVVNAIPIAGPVISSSIDLLLGSPSEKRKMECLNAFDERIRLLEEQNGLDLALLAQNEQFIDVLMEIAPLYIKTSIKQKREALLNAMSNVALNIESRQTYTHIYIRLIDTLSLGHLLVLELLDFPSVFFDRLNLTMPDEQTSVLTLINMSIPNFGDEALATIVMRELKNYGLIKEEFTNNNALKFLATETRLSRSDMSVRLTTPLGEDFLKFITFDEPN